MCRRIRQADDAAPPIVEAARGSASDESVDFVAKIPHGSDVAQILLAAIHRSAAGAAAGPPRLAGAQRRYAFIFTDSVISNCATGSSPSFFGTRAVTCTVASSRSRVLIARRTSA